jgi:hypothetical protein
VKKNAAVKKNQGVANRMSTSKVASKAAANRAANRVDARAKRKEAVITNREAEEAETMYMVVERVAGNSCNAG